MTVTSEPDMTGSATRLEQVAPGYLERVRRATVRLAARPDALADPRMALEALADVTTIAVDVPTASNRRSGRLIKVMIRRSLGWYLRYVGDQVTVMGQAVGRLGTTLVERTEQLGDETTKLQGDTAKLQGEVRTLADRVSCLERKQP